MWQFLFQNKGISFFKFLVYPDEIKTFFFIHWEQFLKINIIFFKIPNGNLEIGPSSSLQLYLTPKLA